MTNYQEMYLTMVRASEKAIDLLVEAQKKCEEMYLSMPEPDLRVLPIPTAQGNTPDKT